MHGITTRLFGLAEVQTFNNLTSPILYHRVSTDRLDQLLYGVDAKPSKGRKVRNKRELLKYTRHLDLEYPDPHQDIPYHLLLRDGGWPLVGLPPAHVARSKLVMWIGMFIRNFRIIERLTDVDPDMWALDTLTYNACLPADDKVWEKALHGNGWNETLQEQLLSAQDLAGRFVLSSNAKHFCQRSSRGPLRLVQLQAYNKEYRPGRHGAPTVTVHNQEFDHRLYGSARKMRWVHETPAAGWKKPVGLAVQDVFDEMLVLPDLIDHMELSLISSPHDQDHEKSTRMIHDPPQMSFFVSRPVAPVDLTLRSKDAVRAQKERDARIAEQRSRVKRRMREIQRQLDRSDSMCRVKVSLDVVEDAPRCEACGV